MESAHSLFRRVRRIEIHTRKLVEQLIGGDYRSIFRGHGMEFCEFRRYTEGDDPRLMDWNVTARTSQPHVRVLTEERELQVMLLVDVSGSLNFGSVSLTKAERVAETAALLALSAVRSNDRTGLLSFSNRVHDYIPPDKGRSHALGIIKRVLEASEHREKADINNALGYLGRVLKRKALIFLISDFRYGGEARKTLRSFSARHDLVGIHVFDPRETRVPPVGRILFRDPETGATRVADTSSRQWQEEFGKKVQALSAARESLCREARLDIVSISTADDLVLPLRRFFAMRKRRRRH
jgi:uncharacterized protein (DUF58 family)